MLFVDTSIDVLTKSFLFPPVDYEGTLFQANVFAYYVQYNAKWEGMLTVMPGSM
jgi:hypothetical protein